MSNGLEDQCQCYGSDAPFDYTTFQCPMYRKWKHLLPQNAAETGLKYGEIYVHVDCLLPGNLWAHVLHRYCFECGESFSSIVDVCPDCWDYLDSDGQPEVYPSWPTLAQAELAYRLEKYPKISWKKHHSKVRT